MNYEIVSVLFPEVSEQQYCRKDRDSRDYISIMERSNSQACCPVASCRCGFVVLPYQDWQLITALDENDRHANLGVIRQYMGKRPGVKSLTTMCHCRWQWNIQAPGLSVTYLSVPL